MRGHYEKKLENFVKKLNSLPMEIRMKKMGATGRWEYWRHRRSEYCLSDSLRRRTDENEASPVNPSSLQLFVVSHKGVEYDTELLLSESAVFKVSREW